MSSKALTTRVLARFEKQAMPVVLRDVAGHNWGWFSREDPRMHLQTVDDNRSGRDAAKVWLEERGKRICEPASKLDAKMLKQLSKKILAERQSIERRWIKFMIQNEWLRAELSGRNVILTAYPSSHNSFKRTIDLHAEFPGAYKGERSWDLNAPKADLDFEHCALAVGPETKMDDRNHFDLTKLIFTDQ